MDPKEEERKVNIAFAVMLAVIVVMIALSFTGCKTVKVAPEVHTEYVHDTIMQVDSVWQDRVHVEYMRGDTIVLRDSVYKYVYKTLDKVVEVVQVDSVPYPVEVDVPARYVPGYYHFASWALWILVAILAVIVGVKILKRRYFDR